MKKAGFLAKLKEEGRIQIVDPSEEVKAAYLERSEESLSSAKALFKIKNFRDSVAMAYYSMYYSLLALLFRAGVKCENHAGSIILLKEVFGIDNTRISTAKKERVDKQYYIDFSITGQEVSGMIEVAEEFNGYLLSFIDALNSGRIKEYRDIASRLIR